MHAHNLQGLFTGAFDVVGGGDKGLQCLALDGYLCKGNGSGIGDIVGLEIQNSQRAIVLQCTRQSSGARVVDAARVHIQECQRAVGRQRVG